jgi:hypothetical protein
MNQQLIFNNDFVIDTRRNAIAFSCLVAGFKVSCFISIPTTLTAKEFLAEIKADAFSWEDSAEQAIASDAFTAEGEIWL